MMLGPRLIRRYIFREILPPTLFGLTLYSSVLIMNRIFQLVDLAIRKDIPAVSVLKLIGFSLPRLFALTIPLAVLLGVLVGIARLAADSEIIAMRASGIHRSAFLFPVLFLSLTAALIGVVDMLWVEPRANYAAHHLVSRTLRESEAATGIQPGVFYDAIPGVVIHASGARPETGQLEKLVLFREMEDGTEELTLAELGMIRYDLREDRLKVQLEGCTTYMIPEGNEEEHRLLKAGSRDVLLPPDPTLRIRLEALHRGVPKNYAELSFTELREKLYQAGNLPHPQAIKRVQGTIRSVLQEKFAIPAACIVFGLFSLGLGLRARRAGRTSGFAVSIGVIIGYWMVYTMGRSLATRGLIPATIGLWFANFLFLGMAVVLLSRRDVSRSRVPRRPALSASPAADRLQPRQVTRFSKGPYRRAGLISLLDRHVLGYFLRAFFFVGLSLYVIFVLVEFRDLIDEVIENGHPVSLLWKFFLFRFPWTIQQILPMAAMIGSVAALGQLTKNLEISAFQAGGVSLYRIATPVLLITLAFCGIGYLIQDHVLPVSNREAGFIKDQIRGRNSRIPAQPLTHWIWVKERELVHYRNYRRSTREFQGLSIYRFRPDEFRLESRGFAQTARWREGVWQLRDGWWRNFRQPEGSGFDRFTETRLADADFPAELFDSDFPFPFQLFPNAARDTSEQMSFGELLEFIRRLKKNDFQVPELQVALQNKISYPLIPFVMVLLGVPAAFRSGRKGTLYGLGISLVMVLLYYACFAGFSGMGNAGYLRPFLAAWGPNFLFTAWGVFLLARLRS